MKLFCIIIAASLLGGGSAHAQRQGQNALGPPVDNRLANSVRANDAERRFRASFANQWRIVDGVVTNMSGAGWWYIEGTVFQAFKGNALVTVPGGGGMVMVANCGPIADGEWYSGLAMPAGVYEYPNLNGASRTVRKFDCGTPYTRPQPSRTQVALARDEASRAAFRRAEEQRDMAPKVLQFQLEQATNGLPSFQYIAGQRYLKGDGVEPNEQLAIDWFTKAAAQGDGQAKKALEEIRRSRNEKK